MEHFGVFLHHDAITGTAKRKVDEDYFKRIKEIETSLFKLLSNKFGNNAIYFN